MTFTDKLRDLRSVSDLNQRDFARALGMTQAMYQRLESGTTIPTLMHLLHIAHFLEVSLDEFVRGIDSI